MPALIWDSATSAWKEASTPKVYNSNSNAFVDCGGKMYNGSAWVDVFSLPIRNFTIGISCRCRFSTQYYRQDVNRWGSASYVEATPSIVVNYNKTSNLLTVTSSSNGNNQSTNSILSPPYSKVRTQSTLTGSNISTFYYDNGESTGGMNFSFNLSLTGSISINVGSTTKTTQISRSITVQKTASGINSSVTNGFTVVNTEDISVTSDVTATSSGIFTISNPTNFQILN